MNTIYLVRNTKEDNEYEKIFTTDSLCLLHGESIDAIEVLELLDKMGMIKLVVEEYEMDKGDFI